MDTKFYTERFISDTELANAFSNALHVAPESIAIVHSDDLAGAAIAWGDPSHEIVLRCWEVPGELPHAIEAVSHREDLSGEGQVLTLLRRVAAELKIPLFTIETDVFAALLVIFPDGSELVVDEDGSVPDPVTKLTSASRREYEKRRMQVELRAA